MSDLFAETEETYVASGLTSLKEQLEHLIDRAKYYGEGEHPPQEYVEIMQDLLARTNHILRMAE